MDTYLEFISFCRLKPTFNKKKKHQLIFALNVKHGTEIPQGRPHTAAPRCRRLRLTRELSIKSFENITSAKGEGHVFFAIGLLLTVGVAKIMFFSLSVCYFQRQQRLCFHRCRPVSLSASFLER